jgi:FtsP/CotA-like multicopper oxidase with cupredoxin domain
MKRREFITRTLAGAGVLIPSGTALWVGGCKNGPRASQIPEGYVPRRATQTGPTREARLVAAPGQVDVGGRSYSTWLYNDRFPGPEIRVREGERLRVTVENRLPEPTTVHWHGIPLPNPMDGVPGVTQPPIEPGETFVYDFIGDVPGSYLYHSHVGLQIDRGLIGALVIEEKTPRVAYDREYTLVLDDFLPDEPKPLGGGPGRATPGGRMGRGMTGGMMGMMGGLVPPYVGLLINGQPAQAPAVFATKRGDRVRLRILNPSGATTYRVAIAGHRMTVVSTDGQPVEPLVVDALTIGMGERCDVLIETTNPGAWTVMAVSVDSDLPPARAVLRYLDAAAAVPPIAAVPEGLGAGHLLDLSDLHAVEERDGRTPDRTIDLTLSGGMMMSTAWTIDGQAYPDAEPIEIHEGERVRVRMINHSMMLHPMHLHGHFFRTADVIKDTVIVPPHMGRASLEFTADNPGNWFFHCHNIYHMESGMARVIRYT